MALCTWISLPSTTNLTSAVEASSKARRSESWTEGPAGGSVAIGECVTDGEEKQAKTSCRVRKGVSVGRDTDWPWHCLRGDKKIFFKKKNVISKWLPM